MTVGEKIKEAREKKGLTQSELAQLLGYKSRSSINKIEVNDRDIPRSSILMFAKALDVTPSYLMGWEDNSEVNNSVDEKIESNIEFMSQDKIHMVPVFESVSAGFGAYACSDIVDYIPLFINNPADVPDMMCIKVQGDSMFPIIDDGDIVVVRKQSSVDSGQIAVVLIDNEEGFVKRIEYDHNTIELKSENPYYKPMFFSDEETLRVNVVGLVKQVIKNL